MIDIVLEESDPPVPLWLDVRDPTSEDLALLAARYDLHATALQDCMEPAHLPKHEELGSTTFMIARAFDDKCPLGADDVQSMTRKVAFFIGNRFLITLHRQDQPFFEKFRSRVHSSDERVFLQVIMLNLLLAIVETYHAPLEEAELRLHAFEKSILHDDGSLNRWDDVFRTKCRLMNIKRILWHTMNTVQKFVPHSSENQPRCQDLRERIESLLFFADGLLGDLDSLLNIQMSLASHRTNQVVRVLTLFSAFFLPITFIVGVYGMNFQYMPELSSPYGYAGVWSFIGVTTISVYLWFRHKGWLR